MSRLSSEKPPRLPSADDIETIAELAALDQEQSQYFGEWLNEQLPLLTDQMRVRDVPPEAILSRWRLRVKALREAAALFRDEDNPLLHYRLSFLDETQFMQGAVANGWFVPTVGDNQPGMAALLSLESATEKANALDAEADRKEAFLRVIERLGGLPRDKGGRPPEVAREIVCRLLIQFYEVHLGRRATGSPGGQFLLFVSATFEALGWDSNVDRLVQRELREYRAAQAAPDNTISTP
jgi:hypothetical protein